MLSQLSTWVYARSLMKASVPGALACFGRAWPVVAGILPQGHTHEQALVICVGALWVGCGAVLAGGRRA